MEQSKSDMVIAFTRALITANTAYRQFIQQKFKEQNVGLTYEMLQVMACLWNEDGINQQEIANITVKDKASMTYLIDNLTRRGLVTRLEDATDRRSKLIMLTEEGRKMKTTIKPILDEMYAVAGKGLDIATLQHSMYILEIIENNLKK